jgi:hypothetical protein
MGGHNAPMPYKPEHQKGADSAYYNTLGGLTAGNQGTFDTAAKGFQNSYQKIEANPYNESAQTGINKASGDAWNAGAQGIADAGRLGSYAEPLVQYGFDPQGSNYNWGMKGAQDQQNLASSRAGVAGSPFAAGMAADAGQGFQRQWDQDKFGRAQSALQSLAQLFQARQGMASAGAGQEAVAAAAPQEAYNNTNFTNMQALQALVDGMGGASRPLQGDVGQYGDYLNIGQNSTRIANDVTKTNNANGGILGGLGGLFGMAANFAMPGGGSLGGSLLKKIIH